MRAGLSPWRAASPSISAGRTRVGFFAIGLVFPSARNAPLRKTASSLRRLRKFTESLRSATRAPEGRDLQYHPESPNVVTRLETGSGQSERIGHSAGTPPPANDPSPRRAPAGCPRLRL